MSKAYYGEVEPTEKLMATNNNDTRIKPELMIAVLHNPEPHGDASPTDEEKASYGMTPEKAISFLTIWMKESQFDWMDRMAFECAIDALTVKSNQPTADLTEAMEAVKRVAYQKHVENIQTPLVTDKSEWEDGFEAGYKAGQQAVQDAVAAERQQIAGSIDYHLSQR